MISNLRYELGLKLNYGIKIFHNILTEEERKLLLKEINPLLMVVSNEFSGLQTGAHLHCLLLEKGHYNIIKKIIKKSKLSGEVDKCWVNYTDFDMRFINWHNHPETKKTLVYMLENPENLGTFFMINGKELRVKCPENSLITFDPKMMHSLPNNVTKPRYSLAIDFK